MTKPRPVRWSAAGRCPRCGQGKLFAGYLKVAPSCDSCGLDYAAQDAADGPAVLIILFFGFVVAGLVLTVEMLYAPAMWIHALIWPPFILVGSLGLLRPFKGAFIGIQYKYQSDETEPSSGADDIR